MAWAGRFFTASKFSAPKYCETIEDMALRVWPKTQINMERKVVTMPTAAKDSVALLSMLPIIAASVKDKIGSETPEISAGIASLLICFNEMSVLKGLVHNNEMGTHFV